MIFDLHIPRGGSIYDTVYVISASHGGHRSKFNAAEGKLIFGRYWICKLKRKRRKPVAPTWRKADLN